MHFSKVCLKNDNVNLLSKILANIVQDSSEIKKLNNLLAKIISSGYYKNIKEIELNETTDISNGINNMFNDYI